MFQSDVYLEYHRLREREMVKKAELARLARESRRLATLQRSRRHREVLTTLLRGLKKAHAAAQEARKKAWTEVMSEVEWPRSDWKTMGRTS